MLFYHFDMLDHFIETNSVDTLKKEKENIEQIIKLYENKKIDLEFKKSYLQKYEDLLKRQYQLLWDFTIEIMGGEKCK